MRKINDKKLENYIPPGMNCKKELQGICWGLLVAILYSFSFLWKYVEARNELYVWRYGSVKMLQEGAVMPTFESLLEGSFDGFMIFVICMAGLVTWHYFTHVQGSKSIYLMRRLPDEWELHRRCILLPAAASVIAVIMAAALVLVYYGIYLFFTPQQCLVF